MNKIYRIYKSDKGKITNISLLKDVLSLFIDYRLLYVQLRLAFLVKYFTINFIKCSKIV
jgi:hypothetical protein